MPLVSTGVYGSSHLAACVLTVFFLLFFPDVRCIFLEQNNAEIEEPHDAPRTGCKHDAIKMNPIQFTEFSSSILHICIYSTCMLNFTGSFAENRDTKTNTECKPTRLNCYTIFLGKLPKLGPPARTCLYAWPLPFLSLVFLSGKYCTVQYCGSEDSKAETCGRAFTYTMVFFHM
jgi:hypothetical protein